MPANKRDSHAKRVLPLQSRFNFALLFVRGLWYTLFATIFVTALPCHSSATVLPVFSL